MHSCATGSCAISALVWPFHRKCRHQTSRDPERVPLEGESVRMRNRKLRNIRSNVTHRSSPGKYGSTNARPEVPFGCSLGRLRPISSMATGTSPFTGYLPLSHHFISAFNNGFHLRCFRIFSRFFVMLCSTPRMLSITSAFSLWGY